MCPQTNAWCGDNTYAQGMVTAEGCLRYISELAFLVVTGMQRPGLLWLPALSYQDAL